MFDDSRTLGGGTMVTALSPAGAWLNRTLFADDLEAADTAAELDELGYGALWLGGSPPHDLHQPEVLLAGSRRIVVGTGIATIWDGPAAALAARHHELTTAFPGRFLLGLGVSHEGMVRRYERPYSKLVEFLDGLDAAATPVPAAERVLAALGPKVLALAGTRAGGAHPYLTTPDHTRQARDILGDGPLLVPEQKVVLDTDPDRARATARRRLGPYLALPNYLNSWRRLGFTDDDFTGDGSERLVDTVVAWGDVDTVVRRLAEHREAGATQVAVQVLTADDGLPHREWRELAPALQGL
jgi:probable F420-dependent oxidoreductase